ncbi:thiamine phosphate synthase [Crassaminicella profunda]|nr:thiamine phosphate synthase [Crassaminicella profunda]QZY55939.1 thiamine phosphate synthase [Crassaminicella profunda]
MNLNKESLQLYLVTDSSWTQEKTLMEQVRESLEKGVTFLQLREKTLDHDQFLELAKEMKELADSFHIPFVINDNIKIALESHADGIHIGQKDMPIEEARKQIGKDKILGVSVGNVKEALIAEKLGADYLGVGAMFLTDTKKDAKNVPIETLKNICEAVSIPVVAIGGINKENILKLKDSGADGVAVISAILAKKDIKKVTCELKTICEKIF